MIIHLENYVKRRFYTFYLHKDLFDCWMLTRYWGSLDTQRGNSHNDVFFSYDDCMTAIKENLAKRFKRGYKEVGQ
jgi:predicted DNA-binding WGR domain protein